MNKMIIYEPAMCCSTGLCGVGVDPELLRISTVVNTIKKTGNTVNRFNLSSSPQEFVTNAGVNRLIMDAGMESLPVTVLDGEIVKTGAYPTNEEILSFLELPESTLTNESKPAATLKLTQKPRSGCGCGCGDGNCC